MHDLLSLTGKTALVSGAASGIGRAVALRLAEAGAALVLVDRDEAGLCVTAEAIDRPGARPAARETVELGTRTAIEALWERLEPAPSVLVNAAGSYPSRPFLTIDEQAYREVVGVNLEAVFWMCQAMIRRRRSQGGSIVNVASVEAVLPFKSGLAHYGPAKAGVVALTRSLAREYGGHGFRVNVVVPGWIDTPGTRRVARELLRLKLGRLAEGLDYTRRLPLGRMGSADEVARVVAFLASDAASYMEGAAVAVDGGFLSA